MDIGDNILRSLPLVAILRGVKPAEAAAIGDALYRGGFRCIEVPLNSPEPLESIETLARMLPADALVGGGTVLDDTAVGKVLDAGGKLIVSPDTNAAVIASARAAGMVVLPGVATATEAFTAVRNGAENLKLFPASTYGLGHAKALSAVLPPSCGIFAVGGISPDTFDEWLEAGAVGFGTGSGLYRPGDRAGDLLPRAKEFVRKYREAASGHGSNRM